MKPFLWAHPLSLLFLLTNIRLSLSRYLRGSSTCCTIFLSRHSRLLCSILTVSYNPCEAVTNVCIMPFLCTMIDTFPVGYMLLDLLLPMLSSLRHTRRAAPSFSFAVPSKNMVYLLFWNFTSVHTPNVIPLFTYVRVLNAVNETSENFSMPTFYTSALVVVKIR